MLPHAVTSSQGLCDQTVSAYNRATAQVAVNSGTACRKQVGLPYQETISAGVDFSLPEAAILFVARMELAGA